MPTRAKAKRAPAGPGRELADQLFDALDRAGRAPRPGARDLPELTGVLPRGGFGEPQENVLAKAIDLLVGAGKAFGHGNSIVMEATLDADGPRLAPLRTGTAVEGAAR